MTARIGMIAIWSTAAALTFAAASPAAEPASPASAKPSSAKPATTKPATAPPASPERIARLIHTLGASDYAVRQGADDELVRFGPEARREIEAALESDDAEVRLRAQKLLDRIKIADMWAPTLVEVTLDHEPVSKGFDAAARQTNNHLMMGDAHTTASDALVNATARSAPFWEVVDELCRQSGNHVRPNYDSHSPGLVVASGAPGQYPTAYSGPLRVQLMSARRLFTEELDFESGKSAVTHSFQLNLQLMWEDRFRLVAYTSGPTLVEAMPQQGKAPVATSTSANWNVTNGSTRQVTASMRITPPAVDSKTLSSLRLKWGLVAVGDMQTARIEPLAAKTRFQRGDLLVTVETLERQSAGRCELTLWVARELAVPEPQEILLEENSLDLFDQHGKRFRLLSQSNSLGDGGVQMKLSFAGDSAESEPQALAITYPRLRSRRELEIVFRNAPLPVGRPE